MRRFTAALLALLLALPAAAQKNEKKESHSFAVAKSLDVFNAIYRDLDRFYVDTLDAGTVVGIGIEAMLSSLDPYTEYFPEEEMGDLKMLTTGKYGGIGSLIRMRKDSTVVVGEPYAGMPAAEVGLKTGDVLLRIDDTDLRGKAVDEVSDLLRGEPGTTFVLRVQRPGEARTRDFKITRRSIKMPSIPYSGLVGGDSARVGYVNLSQFTEDCSVDVRKAVIALRERGAESVVLDLRGNGGGLLSEAVNIVGLFVPKGKTIVETRGKVRAANATYRTKGEPLDTELPVAVLVNGSTASAAEIVSGALQDLDRAVVVGARTFGKGLVQSPREMPYNGSLKLTTSKYYIPSGRCIQAIDYKHQREAGTDGRVPDSLAHEFRPAAGRIVRDGGGITPDVVVKHDTMASIVFYLTNDDVLLDWGTRYAQAHPALPPVADFKVTDDDFATLLAMAKESGFKYDRLSEKRLGELKKVARMEGCYEEARPEFDALEQKLQHDLDRDFRRFEKEIRQLMAQEVVKRYHYQAGAIEEALKDDADLRRAVGILGDSAEYRRILAASE